MTDTVSLIVPDVTDALLSEMVSKIVKHFHPDKVILFGSRAWGEPTKKSNPDIPWSAMERMRDLHIPADDKVNLNEVWDTVQDDTPVLISGLERIVPPEDEI